MEPVGKGSAGRWWRVQQQRRRRTAARVLKSPVFQGCGHVGSPQGVLPAVGNSGCVRYSELTGGPGRRRDVIHRMRVTVRADGSVREVLEWYAASALMVFTELIVPRHDG